MTPGLVIPIDLSPAILFPVYNLFLSLLNYFDIWPIMFMIIDPENWKSAQCLVIICLIRQMQSKTGFVCLIATHITTKLV